MEDHQPRRSGRIEWVPLARTSGMIARPTLTALQDVLTAEDERPAHHVPGASQRTVTIALSEHPELGEVGGIARLDREGGPPIGVARVGQSSYAAYRPAGADESVAACAEIRRDSAAVARQLGLPGLIELGVEYNGVEGTLTIGGEVG